MRTLLLGLLLWSCDSKDGDSVSASDDSTPEGDDSASVDEDNDGVDATKDCNDADASIHPGATEVVADGTDQDCDGNDLCYTDADGDGFGSAKTVAATTCEGAGVASTSTDCGDGDATVYPAAKELVADGIDQDCDGGDVCFVDADGDGFGSPLTLTSSDVDCTDAGESSAADDCLDVGKDASETFPGSAELDSDTDCMTDVDGDGYGSSSPAKGVTSGTDCNDVDSGPCPEFHLGADKEFSDASSHSPDYLLGNVIVVPSDMTLTALALIGKSTGANVKMALYTDSSGAPDTLVAETDSNAVPAGVLEIPVTEVALPAGNYWIMAVFDTFASVGISFPSGEVCQYRSLSFSSAMPDPFGSVSTYKGQLFNYYIVGY
jgi:hypothetical protein